MRATTEAWGTWPRPSPSPLRRDPGPPIGEEPVWTQAEDVASAWTVFGLSAAALALLAILALFGG